MGAFSHCFPCSPQTQVSSPYAKAIVSVIGRFLAGSNTIWFRKMAGCLVEKETLLKTIIGLFCSLLYPIAQSSLQYVVIKSLLNEWMHQWMHSWRQEQSRPFLKSKWEIEGSKNFLNYRKKVKSLSCVWLFATPWTVDHQGPLFVGFSRQEYWSGLPFPSPGDLPNPGIEPRCPASLADALPHEPPGKHNDSYLELGGRISRA